MDTLETFKTQKEKEHDHPTGGDFGGLTRSHDQSEIEKVIEKSTFVIHQGAYVYVKARKKPDTGKHFIVSDDEEEITVITKEENLRHVDVAERNKESYALIRLTPSNRIYSMGFLAAISNLLAKAGLTTFLVSTFSKDYLLVSVKDLEKAKQIMLNLGMKELSQGIRKG